MARSKSIRTIGFMPNFTKRNGPKPKGGPKYLLRNARARLAEVVRERQFIQTQLRRCEGLPQAKPLKTKLNTMLKEESRLRENVDFLVKKFGTPSTGDPRAKSSLAHDSPTGSPKFEASLLPMPPLENDGKSEIPSERETPTENSLQALRVPLPIERDALGKIRINTSREGQSAFRSVIISAYGRCAVSGCQIEAALDAAHIIPYVDARSNIISNGLCLRSDIHRLFDANLLEITPGGEIKIAQELILSEYNDFQNTQIILPINPAHYPDERLLEARTILLGQGS